AASQRRDPTVRRRSEESGHHGHDPLTEQWNERAADIAIGFLQERRGSAEAAVRHDEFERADSDGAPPRRCQARREDPRRELLSASEQRVERRGAQILKKDGGPGEERELLERPGDFALELVPDRPG